jgi:hypothetical protein
MLAISRSKKFLLSSGDHIIAVLGFGELSGPDVGSIVLHGIGYHFCDIAVFFYEFGYEGLELADGIGYDQ